MMVIACLNILGAFPDTDIKMPFTRLCVLSYCGLLEYVNSMDEWRPVINDYWINPIGRKLAYSKLITSSPTRLGDNSEHEYQLTDKGKAAAADLQAVWEQLESLVTLDKNEAADIIEEIQEKIPCIYKRDSDKARELSEVVDKCQALLGMAPMQICLLVGLYYKHETCNLYDEMETVTVGEHQFDGSILWSWWDAIADDLKSQGLLDVEGYDYKRTVALTDRGRQVARELSEVLDRYVDNEDIRASLKEDTGKKSVAAETPAAATATPAERNDSLTDNENKLSAPEKDLCNLLQNHGNVILHGAPGTGKTYAARRIADYLCGGDPERVQFVQFHQSYDYTDFVEGLRPCGVGDDGQLRFELRSGIFMEFCLQAAQDPENTYVFIIDEINRGDLSRIFGELFFCIDPDYRGVQGRTMTQYSNMWPDEEDSPFSDGFYVPENLYIIATMNDIDRSVETMDFAMRRRFVFYEITAANSEDMLQKLKEKGDGLYKMACAKMESLNAKIANTDVLGTQYQIGGAYFLKLAKYLGEDGKDEKQAWELLWEHHLCSLLREYLRGLQDAGGVQSTIDGLKQAYDDAVPAAQEAAS